jgi:hypothetical protein
MSVSATGRVHSVTISLTATTEARMTIADNKLQLLDTLIARVQEQLRSLNTRHNELLDQLTESPELLDAGGTGPASEMTANRTQAASLQQQLASLEQRRVDLEEQARGEAAQAAREQFKDEALAKGARVRASAKRRVDLGKNLDKLLKQVGERLAELEELGATMRADAIDVVRVAMTGGMHAQHRIQDALAAFDSTLHGGSADALVSQLLANGIGHRGIQADMLFRNVPSASGYTIEQAFAQAARRSEQRIAGWLHEAFGDSAGESEQVVRVRATRDGFDGLRVRTEGEVFDFTLQPGRDLGNWMEPAEGESIVKPDPGPALTVDELRVMNPGAKVHQLAS